MGKSNMKVNYKGLNRALNREKKRRKTKLGMRRDGDSVKNIERIQKKRKDKILKKYRVQKEEMLLVLTGE
jgi:hypothetical protein